MPRIDLDRMARAIRSHGVTVEVAAGAASRGNASFNPRGVVCHWTAGPRGTTGRPSLGVVTNGRPGLPGPLCQVYLDRKGVAVIVATGRANHAGTGGWRGLSGNSSVLGIEAECGGDGDWTAAQREAYPKLAAALLSLTPNAGDERFVCGHNEWAPSRKIDIRDWPMSRMRTQVKAAASGTPIHSPERTWFDMATLDDLKKAVQESVPAARIRVNSTGGTKRLDEAVYDLRVIGDQSREVARQARKNAEDALTVARQNREILRGLRANTASILELVEGLAERDGVPRDEVVRVVREAAEKALEDVEITLRAGD